MAKRNITQASHPWPCPAWAIACLCGATFAGTLGCDVDEQLNPAALDAGSTPVPDAGTDAPPRTLVERPLFGQMPLDNRMHDPGFAEIDGVGWTPYDAASETLVKASRAFLPRTPLDQPALRIERDAEQTEAAVVGEAKSAAGPVAVSVWLGRPAGQDPMQDVDVSLLGLYLDNEAGAVDLAPDDSSEALTLSEIRWRRVSATIAEGPVAFTYLRVATTLEGPLYLSSPILVAADSGAQARSAHVGDRRPLSVREAKSLRVVAGFMRERFRLPAERHKRRLRSAWRGH